MGGFFFFEPFPELLDWDDTRPNANEYNPCVTYAESETCVSKSSEKFVSRMVGEERVLFLLCSDLFFL